MSKLVYYKIVEMRNGKPHFLFHGIDGSREIPIAHWIHAVKKPVTDGGRGRGTEYESGIHVMETREEAEKYLDRFKHKENRVILPCLAIRVRKKEHSPHNVWLADAIWIGGVSSDDIRPCMHCGKPTSFQRHDNVMPQEGEMCSVCEKWVCVECVSWKYMAKIRTEDTICSACAAPHNAMDEILIAIGDFKMGIDRPEYALNTISEIIERYKEVSNDLNASEEESQ